jgi:hypothetical protein
LCYSSQHYGRSTREEPKESHTPCGFGAILVYYLLDASQSYILKEGASNLTVESYRTAMTVLHSIACTLFAWGFFLLAKEYRDQ